MEKLINTETSWAFESAIWLNTLVYWKYWSVKGIVNWVRDDFSQHFLEEIIYFCLFFPVHLWHINNTAYVPTQPKYNQYFPPRRSSSARRPLRVEPAKLLGDVVHTMLLCSTDILLNIAKINLLWFRLHNILKIMKTCAIAHPHDGNFITNQKENYLVSMLVHY